MHNPEIDQGYWNGGRNRKIEIVPGEGAVKGEAYMRDDFIDRKIKNGGGGTDGSAGVSGCESGKYFGRTGNREKKDSKNTGWKESESNGTPLWF